MASCKPFFPTPEEFYTELEERSREVEKNAFERFAAARLYQSIIRGRFTRRYFTCLSFFATVIQSAYRKHMVTGMYHIALKIATQRRLLNYYNKSAAKIQALWRGHVSRKTKFCYHSYRAWLSYVTNKGERLSAENAEFRLRTKADDRRLLDEDARKWLAFVVFKLHHLMRTQHRAGIFSQPATTELSQFEKLLKAIRYEEYMRCIKKKYEEFVRNNKPKVPNKELLFPVIGDGHDYWYLTLPELYDLAAPVQKDKNTRHKMTHHGSLHDQPFLWRKPRPFFDENRGPFTARKISKAPRVPAGSPATEAGDHCIRKQQKDPRFHLYLKHYKPNPDLLDYVDYHVNILIARWREIKEIES